MGSGSLSCSRIVASGVGPLEHGIRVLNLQALLWGNFC